MPTVRLRGPARTWLRRAARWVILTAALAHAGSAPAGSAFNRQDSANQNAAAPAPCVVVQDGDSHVRSVVISHVQGTVGIDRGKGRGVEQAMQNIPVVQGMKLVTADGYAEVEFEDGTHVRLTPSTVVAFDQLALHGTGSRATVVGVRLGTVYVFTGEPKGSEIRLQVGATCISVSRSTHLRLEITPERIELSVFSGGASVEAPAGHTVAVKKNDSLPFHVAEGGMATIVPGIEKRPYDAWEKEAMKLHESQVFRRALPSIWH
jgi:hypothetical protein